MKTILILLVIAMISSCGDKKSSMVSAQVPNETVVTQELIDLLNLKISQHVSICDLFNDKSNSAAEKISFLVKDLDDAILNSKNQEIINDERFGLPLYASKLKQYQLSEKDMLTQQRIMEWKKQIDLVDGKRLEDKTFYSCVKSIQSELKNGDFLNQLDLLVLSSQKGNEQLKLILPIAQKSFVAGWPLRLVYGRQLIRKITNSKIYLEHESLELEKILSELVSSEEIVRGIFDDGFAILFTGMVDEFKNEHGVYLNEIIHEDARFYKWSYKKTFELLGDMNNELGILEYQLGKNE